MKIKLDLKMQCKICPAFENGKCKIGKTEPCAEGVLMRLMRAINIYKKDRLLANKAKVVINECLDDLSIFLKLDGMPILDSEDKFSHIETFDVEEPVAKAKEIFGGKWSATDYIE